MLIGFVSPLRGMNLAVRHGHDSVVTTTSYIWLPDIIDVFVVTHDDYSITFIPVIHD